MKNKVCILLVMVSIHITGFSQCGINSGEILEKYCNGVYLQHKELSNVPNGKVTFMLKKNDRYAIYFLNPSNALPDFTLSGGNISAIRDVVSQINKKDKVFTYVFTAGESGEYRLTYNFNSEEKACVLMAIYLQNLNAYKPGVYSDFNEMKYNNPSSSDLNKIVSRVVKLGVNQVAYYKFDVSGSHERKPGKTFGFSDGKNLYINRKEVTGFGKEFVKLANYGKYGYFEDIIYMPVGTSVVPKLTYNLLDMNNGDIIHVDRKHLRELLAGDPELLNAFNNEPQKERKFRDYIIKYLESSDKSNKQ